MQIAGWDRDETECADDVEFSNGRFDAWLGHLAGSAWVLGLMIAAKLAGMAIRSSLARDPA